MWLGFVGASQDFRCRLCHLSCRLPHSQTCRCWNPTLHPQVWDEIFYSGLTGCFHRPISNNYQKRSRLKTKQHVVIRCALSPDSVKDDKIFSMLPKKNTGGTPHMYHWTTVEQPDSMIVFSANVAGLNQQPKNAFFSHWQKDRMQW